jgi:hypothetical protein
MAFDAGGSYALRDGEPARGVRGKLVRNRQGRRGE